MDSNPWFLSSIDKSASLRLFCFPPAGRGASLYARWRAHFRPDIEICPVQLPGRENRIREKPYSSIPDLLNALMPWMEPHLDLPYAFFGHSMGALLGFELARMLLKQGHSGPRHLIVSARRAPHLRDPHPPISCLPDDAFLESVQRRYQGIPSSLLQDPEMRAIILRSLRSDFMMLENYTFCPEVKVPCPITSLGGLQDPEAREDELNSWSGHNTCEFRMKMFPGDHFFILSSTDSVIKEVKLALRQ